MDNRTLFDRMYWYRIDAGHTGTTPPHLDGERAREWVREHKLGGRPGRIKVWRSSEPEPR